MLRYHSLGYQAIVYNMIASHILDSIIEWAKSKSFMELLTSVLEKDDDEQDPILAICIASSLNATQENDDSATSRRLTESDDLASFLGLNMRTHWTPTGDAIFNRMSKKAMQTVLVDAGFHAEASSLTKLTKGDTVTKTARILSETDWLPPILRTKETG